MFRGFRVLLGMLALGLASLGLTAASAQESMSEPNLDANKALVESFVAALNAHDLTPLDDILSDDFVEHNPFVGDAPPGRDGFVLPAMGIMAAFPDVVVHIDLIAAEGDLVATRHTVTATNEGDFNGIPATGKQVMWTENHIFRIADGKIVEHWGELNALGLFTQLGAMPPAS